MPTVQDLIFRINSDMSIAYNEKMALINQILAVAQPMSPITVLLNSAVGALIGGLAAKYFNMGATSTALGTLLGGLSGSYLTNKGLL